MNNKIVVLLMLLFTAGIAYAAEDWNLGSTSTFIGVTATKANVTDLYVSGNITGLVANESYSYIIWTDGTNYYAKNGSTGKVDYSGTNASTVINAALSQLNGNRSIFFRSGIYNISAPLIINHSNILFSGEVTGWDSSLGGTRFNKTGNTNIIDVVGTSTNRIERIKFQNFNIDGNYVYTGNGINLSYVKYIFIDGVSILYQVGSALSVYSCYTCEVTNSLIALSGIDATTPAIYMRGDIDNTNVEIDVHHNTIANNHYRDIQIMNGVDIDIADNNIESYQVVNHIYASTYTTISNNYMIGANGSGILTDGGNDIKIINNYLELVKNSGIETAGGYPVLIDGNTIFSSVYYGIASHAKGSSVVNNVLFNNSGGIFIYGANEIIIGNKLYDNPGTAILVGKPYTVISGNTIFNSAGTITISGIEEYSLAANNRITGNMIQNVPYPTTKQNNSAIYNNFGAAPYNFGNNATAPAAFGAGDTYFNSTRGAQCLYTTSWVYIGNSTGVC